MVSIKNSSDILLISVTLFTIILSVVTMILVYGVFIISPDPVKRLVWFNAVLIPWVILFFSLLIYCSLQGLVSSHRVNTSIFIVLPCLAVGIVSSLVHTLLLLSMAISALCLIQIYKVLTNIKEAKHIRKKVPSSHIAHFGLAFMTIGVILDGGIIIPLVRVHADGIMWWGSFILTVGCLAAYYVSTKEPVEVEYISKKDIRKRYEKRLQEELKKLREGNT